MMMKDRVLAALAYVLWVPSLYLLLSEKRQEEYLGYHGGQAFVLWLIIFLAFFATRFLVNLVWSYYYFPYLDLLEVFVALGLWGYAVYCGVRCLRAIDFRIPH
jgi:uncharacterized membrane protein